MSDFWAAELWRLFGIAAAAALVGLAAGHLLLLLFLAACGYIAWLLFKLARFEDWLRQELTTRPLESSGIVGELAYQFYRLVERYRRRERRLADALNRFQRSAAAMPDATVVLASQGEIEWFNDAATRLLGLQRQDRGQRIVNLLRHPEFLRFYEQAEFSEILEFPSPVDFRIVLSIQVVPYGDDQRLLIGRDVTYLHRLEQVRRDFVANVSHELRTPLTVISGYLENLSSADDECVRRWRRSLDFMGQHAARMQRLVDDLLLLSRLETAQGPAKQDKVSVPAMLEHIRDEAQALSGTRGHEIILEADAGLWLRGSEKELRSAFSNLVVNAVQYTQEGGAVRIRWYGDNTGAHFVVEDSGAGIPEHHIPRLTERFYRVDTGRSRGEGGTGLGLAIVKHVLQNHGAELHIESEVGKGSTFRCDFPAGAVIRAGEGKEGDFSLRSK